jgi:SAM-dependent methyltransferase
MTPTKIIDIEKSIETINDKQSNSLYIKDYIEFTKNYILYRFNQWHIDIQKEDILLPEHIKKLISLLTKVKYSYPTDKELDFYLKHPNTHMLHFAKYVYDRPNQLLHNTRRAIFSFINHDKIYTEDIGATYLFNKPFIQPFIDKIIYDTSIKNNFNVCELGAGTGGLTLSILPILYKDINKYVISDISKVFTKNLKRKLTKFQDKTQYEIWDITNKRTYQDVQYDLIVASNVIHAVPNIKNVLSNITDALSHNGYFLLHETTHGCLSNSAIWGFFKELWDYTDGDIRTCGAFLSAKAWQTLMYEAGFELVAINDDECLQTMFLFKKR